MTVDIADILAGKAPGTVPAALGTRARKIIRAAAKGITPISTVMASPPTYTEGVAAAASTIIGTATTSNGGGSVNTSDATKIIPFGRFEASRSATAGMIDRSTTKLDGSNAGYRRGGHGSFWAFYTEADSFDIAASWGSVPFILYVTDLRTGVRARVQANDIVPSVTSTSYKKWAFADAGPRIVEVRPLYSSAGPTPVFRGLNVPATAAVQPVRFPEEPRVAYVGDSWGDTGGSVNTNVAAMLMPDFIGERLGTRMVLSLSQGGSGMLNDSTGQGTIYQRAIEGSPLDPAGQFGDLDPAKVGAFDIVYLANTLNDRVANNAAWTDAAVAAAYAALVTAVRTKQPNAIIIGLGPHLTRLADISAIPQTRFDALKAAFISAAAGDPRCLYLDNSPTGEPIMFGSAATGSISIWNDASDTAHLTNIGNAAVGRRIGQMTLNALEALI